MARKKHAKPHEEEAGEAWLLPYSDLMTLLLALFIALFAMSQTDASKMQALAQAFTAAFNMGGPSFFSGMGPSTSMSSATVTTGADTADAAYMKENNDLSEAKAKLDQYIQENNLQDQVSTELNEEGLMIRLKERALFASGSAALQGEAERIVPVIAGVLSSLPERVTISGHTDNVPIATAQYPSNWELSSARAVSLMRGVMAVSIVRLRRTIRRRGVRRTAVLRCSSHAVCASPVHRPTAATMSRRRGRRLLRQHRQRLRLQRAVRERPATRTSCRRICAQHRSRPASCPSRCGTDRHGRDVSMSFEGIIAWRNNPFSVMIEEMS